MFDLCFKIRAIVLHCFCNLKQLYSNKTFKVSSEVKYYAFKGKPRKKEQEEKVSRGQCREGELK